MNPCFEKEDGNLIIGTILLGACDEKGDHLFTKDDAKALSEKNAKIIVRLFNAIVDHNRVELSEDDQKN